MIKTPLRPVPFHVLLFGLYPLFFLWSQNYDQIPAFALSRALLFSLALILVVFLLSLALLRSLHKAGVLTSAFLMLFYAYGHLFPLLDKRALFGFVIGRHRYLLLAAALLLAVCALLLLLNKPPRRLTQVLNFSSAILTTLVLVQVIFPYIQNPALIGIELNTMRGTPTAPAAKAASPEDGRDVYYIILDSYGREDLLRDFHGLDNRQFVEDLTALGFSVQDCALSNYDHTPFSLGSSLNMNYLEQLGVQQGPAVKDIQYTELVPLLQHSQVRQKFEEMGYQFVAFKGVYSWINIPDADIFIDNDGAVSILDRQETINFQYLFLHTSALMYLYDLQEDNPQVFAGLPTFALRFLFPNADVFSTREYRQYQANLYALDQLEQLADLPGKQFVYAHLFTTHQPYVFNPDGSFRWPPLDDMNAYNDQVRFTNPRILEIVKEIIRRSPVPPVIVIQGDHGFPNGRDRVKILNAYYLPENGSQALYPEITPVNTFRLIFNQYFGGSYPLLEDHSYHSISDYPYQYEEIPITCPE